MQKNKQQELRFLLCLRSFETIVVLLNAASISSFALIATVYILTCEKECCFLIQFFRATGENAWTLSSLTRHRFHLHEGPVQSYQF